jgi:NMD protein affecting ribosome stability and mRNA decay
MTAQAEVPACEACGRPADDEEVRGLCSRCAFWIDTETDRMRDAHLLDPYAGMDW